MIFKGLEYLATHANNYCDIKGSRVFRITRGTSIMKLGYLGSQAGGRLMPSWIHGLTDWRIDRLIDGCIDRLMDRCIDGLMNKLPDWCIDESMDLSCDLYVHVHVDNVVYKLSWNLPKPLKIIPPGLKPPNLSPPQGLKPPNPLSPRIETSKPTPPQV